MRKKTSACADKDPQGEFQSERESENSENLPPKKHQPIIPKPKKSAKSAGELPYKSKKPLYLENLYLKIQ